MAAARNANTSSLYIDCRCTLGEGITWWPERRALLWTDITESTLWVHGAGGTRRWSLPHRLGSMAPCASGRLLLGLAKGLFIADIDPAKGGGALAVERIVEVESDIPSTRINDGRTDRSGNFVFGTMNEAEGHPAAGSFYQFSPRSGLRRLDLPSVGIANSICFSLDGKTMYFCDSPTRQILRCRYDAASARVTGVEPFATLDDSDGQPDGSIVDADGCLWNAVWGAAAVRRYRADGRMDLEVAVPAKNPTCPVFGGAGLNELFVTTARQEMTTEELERVPHAGGVYRAAIDGVRGLPDAIVPDVS